jgi:hypothetical protein
MQRSLASRLWAATLVAALAVVGCAPAASGISPLTPMAITLGVPAAAVVDLDPGVAAAARAPGPRAVEIVVARPNGRGALEVSAITSKTFRAPGNAVGLISYGGETGDEWNSFVFGIATPDVHSVSLDWPGAAGGLVVNGTWMIALRDKDVTPDRLHWRFLRADGSVAATGDEISG